MTKQNIKRLSDLQTGKYLELGKEWVYGGKDIYVIPTHYLRISKTDHVVKLYYDDKVEIINCELPDEYKVVNGIGRLYAKGQFSKYIINGNEYDMGYFTEVNSLTPINDAKKCEKSEPLLKLKEICEKVGAVVYGGRYVLFLDPEIGSVYKIKNEYRGEEFIDYKCKNGDFSSGYNIYNNDIITFLGNIFEEYSKQLRNELNKFDELKELLK